MIAYGLTGGVGMGKSSAALILARRGIPVVDSDLLARDIVQPGQPALEEIRAEFGPEVIGPDGALRREVLARRVFADRAARERLEAMTHPRIRAKWQSQLEIWRTEGRPVAVAVIPLLFETGAETHFDATVCVACSAGPQRERLAARGWSEEVQAQRRAAQWPIEPKMAAATYVVWNDGPLELLDPQLDRLPGLRGGSPTVR